MCNQNRNIQALLIEIFKIKNGLAPPIMGSMFKRGDTTYNLRNFQEFETERKRALYFGLDTLSYHSLQIMVTHARTHEKLTPKTNLKKM